MQDEAILRIGNRGNVNARENATGAGGASKKRAAGAPRVAEIDPGSRHLGVTPTRQSEGNVDEQSMHSRGGWFNEKWAEGWEA
jgi:hypothetical protein